MDTKIKKSYYAVIPADVRYDKTLPMGARMLYGELTALANEKGYCWATNNYFADLYNVSTVTISNWITKLEVHGYISREIIYKKDSKEVVERRIYIKENFNTSPKFFGEGIKEKFNTPIKENFKDNNTSINITKNIYSDTPSANADTPTLSKNKIPYDDIVNMYNAICISMPKVKVLTDKRKRTIKTVYSNFKCDIGKFKELFELAQKSDFLSGRSGRWHGCNFDWLMNYNNAVKVLEGTYNNDINKQNAYSPYMDFDEERYKC
jgi:hypothetical protein